MYAWPASEVPALPGEGRDLRIHDTATGGLVTRLGELITEVEIEALRGRVAGLRATGRHPEPSGEWPSIPWPPV